MKNKKLISDIRRQMPDECGDFWAELEEAPINVREKPRFSTHGTLRVLAAISLAAAVIIGSLFALSKYDISIFKDTTKTVTSGTSDSDFPDGAVSAEAAALAEKLYKYRTPEFDPNSSIINLKELVPLLPTIDEVDSTASAFTFLYASLSEAEYVGLQKGEPFHLVVYCCTTEQTARQYHQPGNDDALLCNAMLLFGLFDDLETVTFRFGDETLLDNLDINTVITSSFSARQYRRAGNPGGKAAAAGFIGLRDVREYGESLGKFAVLVDKALAIKNAPHQIFTINYEYDETGSPSSISKLFEDEFYEYYLPSDKTKIVLEFLNGDSLPLDKAMARENPVTIEDLLHHELEMNITAKDNEHGVFLSDANMREIYINNIYFRPGPMFIFFSNDELLNRPSILYFDMKQLCEITGTQYHEPTDEVYPKYIKVGGKLYISQDALTEMQISAEINKQTIILTYSPDGKTPQSSSAISLYENWGASSYPSPNSSDYGSSMFSTSSQVNSEKIPISTIKTFIVKPGETKAFPIHLYLGHIIDEFNPYITVTSNNPDVAQVVSQFDGNAVMVKGISYGKCTLTIKLSDGIEDASITSSVFVMNDGDDWPQ